MSLNESKKSQGTQKNTRFAIAGILTTVILLSMLGTSQGKQVTVMDHGLNMPISTYTLPEGWQIVQDIATDLYSGQYSRYKLEKYGPNGEMHLHCGSAVYGTIAGTSFHQVWRQLLFQGLQQKLVNINFGEPSPQGILLSKMKSSTTIMQKFQGLPAEIQLQLLETDVWGQRNGINYEGKAIIWKMPMNFPFMQQQDSGSVSVSVNIAPVGRLPESIEADFWITERVQENPHYQIKKSQLRMAAQKRDFDAHQDRMRRESAIRDANNERWLNDFINN